jgi:hypothetical protein
MQLNIRGVEVQVKEDQVANIVLQHFIGKAQTNGNGFDPQGLKEGEQYAGIILGKNGEQNYHLVLLPGEIEDANWQKSIDWAKSVGGELPTRREQALLYANLKEQFKSEWYWSCEQHAADSDYAWMQGFSTGGQGNDHKSDFYRARAVRRLIIQ